MNSDFDPSLLTAYALGELEGNERVQVALLLESDAHAAQFVEQVRQTVTAVASELDAESVDGLGELHREVIDQRLHEAARSERLRRSRIRAMRRKRWIPLAASVAASIAIVGGSMAFLMPRLYPPIAQTAPESSGSGLAVVRPEPGAVRPPMLPAVEPEDEVASANAANLDDTALDPIDGLVDPRSEEPSTPKDEPAHVAQQRPQGKSAPQAVARMPAKSGKSAPTKVAVGPAVSPEAEARPGAPKVPVSNAPTSKNGKRMVNASTPRDPEAFKEIAKSAASGSSATPRVYENPFRLATDRPHSSFPVRVETSSYLTLRKQILERQRPTALAVRIEELINRFAYHYPAPANDEPPVAASVEVATCPWNVAHRLARVAIKAREGGATVVARGVEVAIEFNPLATSAWRLVGYQNAPASPGHPASVPADLAAGGAATAFYEIIPVSSDVRITTPRDLFTVTVAFRDPHDHAAGWQKIDVAATDAGNGFDRASDDFRFASAVAAFGMVLRDSDLKGNANFADVIRWATSGKGPDESRERAAFIDLVKAARETLP